MTYIRCCVGIAVCSNILQYTREQLATQFGKKTGDMLWCYARGIDDRPLQTERVTLSPSPPPKHLHTHTYLGTATKVYWSGCQLGHTIHEGRRGSGIHQKAMHGTRIEGQC